MDIQDVQDGQRVIYDVKVTNPYVPNAPYRGIEAWVIGKTITRVQIEYTLEERRESESHFFTNRPFVTARKLTPAH